MYNHILVETQDDTLNFFNVKEVIEDDTQYKLLSQNNEWHIFPKATLKSFVI